MAVKLHRCNGQWAKFKGHPCWRVEKALIDQGIDYERIPGPGMPWQRKQRTRLHELTGGYHYPAIEFEDGSAYREDSKQMEARIRAGKLFEGGGAAAAASEPAAVTSSETFSTPSTESLTPSEQPASGEETPPSESGA